MKHTRLILAGLVSSVVALSGGAQAAPLDSPIPAGRKGRLTVQLVQGGAAARSLTLNMNLISQETGFMNTLTEGLTESQAATHNHEIKVLTENPIDIAAFGRVADELSEACRADEDGPACAAAKARLQAFERQMEAANARAETALREGPAADLDNHRFQRWVGDYEAGCGTAVSRVGAKVKTIDAPPGVQADHPGFTVCMSELVLDRRTGKASLKIDPLAYSMPGESQGTFNFLDLERSTFAVKVDVGFIGLPPRAVFKSLAPKGDLQSFSAQGEIPSSRGGPVKLTLRFEQQR